MTVPTTGRHPGIDALASRDEWGTSSWHLVDQTPIDRFADACTAGTLPRC